MITLITGVTGQYSAYLAEFLQCKGNGVHGVKRRSSSLNTGRIEQNYCRSAIGRQKMTSGVNPLNPFRGPMRPERCY